MNAIILTGTASVGVTEILAQVSAVIQLVIDTISTMLGNPFFAFLMAVGFVSMALHLFNVAKGVSRG